MPRRYSEFLVRELEGDPDRESLFKAVQLLDQDPAMGIKELEELSEAGSILSMVYIGDAYERGELVDRDTLRADSWYQMAADSGSLEGAFRLATAHWHDGKYDKAKAELENLSKNGFFPAAYCLGEAYYFGAGLEKNENLAIEYLENADKKGHFLARQTLSFIWRKGKFGIKKKFRGWVMLLNLAVVGVWYKFYFPNSDRFRRW